MTWVRQSLTNVICCKAADFPFLLIRPLFSKRRRKWRGMQRGGGLDRLFFSMRCRLCQRAVARRREAEPLFSDTHPFFGFFQSDIEGFIKKNRRQSFGFAVFLFTKKRRDFCHSVHRGRVRETKRFLNKIRRAGFARPRKTGSFKVLAPLELLCLFHCFNSSKAWSRLRLRFWRKRRLPP